MGDMLACWLGLISRNPKRRQDQRGPKWGHERNQTDWEQQAREKQLLEIQEFIIPKWVYIEPQVTMIWLISSKNLQHCGDMLYTSGRSLLCFWQQHGMFDGRKSVYSKETAEVKVTPMQWKVPAQHMWTTNSSWSQDVATLGSWLLHRWNRPFRRQEFRARGFA